MFQKSLFWPLLAAFLGFAFGGSIASGFHVNPLNFGPFPEHMPDWFVALFTAILSVFTALLWRSTEKLWKAGERQIEVAIQSANAAGISARLAEQTLIASQRPWISAEPEILLPITYNNKCMTVTIRFNCKNVGNTPAQHAIASISLTLTSAGNDAVQHQKNLSSVYRKTPTEFGVGLSIFPQDTKRMDAISDIDLDPVTLSKVSGLTAIAIVRYRSTFAETWHQTGLILELTRFDNHQNQIAFWPGTGNSIPPNQVRIRRNLYGEYAD